MFFDVLAGARSRRGRRLRPVAYVAGLALVSFGALAWAASDGGPSGDSAALSWSPSLPAEAQSYWRELPALAASAAEQMRQAGIEPLQARSQAWGDPSSGCFLFATEMDVPHGSPGSIYNKLSGALAKAGFEIADYEAWPKTSPAAQTPEANGTPSGVRLTFADGTVRGELRAMARSAGPELATARAAACFYSRREPESSARWCQILLQQFEEQP